MKCKNFHTSLLIVIFFSWPVLYAENAPVILPTDNPETSSPMRVVWPTEPGVRYALHTSQDLLSWDLVDGYPAEAAALAQQQAFEMQGDRRFFRVIELDEQPPEIVHKSPGNSSFGVGRFSVITVDLVDRSGINLDSIAFRVGESSSIGISNPALSFDNGTLTYDLGGHFALGDYGELIEVKLNFADSLGNTASYNWSFELEQEIVPTENLFVFGSANAVLAGQQLSGPAAQLAAHFSGPLPMSASSSEWYIETVSEDAVVIAYTSEDAPVFTAGLMITNLAPAHESHFFYREVVSVAVDTSEKIVTLVTVERNLPDFIPEGSFTFGENAVILEFDESGYLVTMHSFTVDLPSIGTDLSGQTVYSSGSLQVALQEARALFHPSVTCTVETHGAQVSRFSAAVEGDFDLAVVPEFIVSGSYSGNVSEVLWSQEFPVQSIVAGVPVELRVSASITFNASINAASEAVFSTGFRQSANIGLVGIYVRNASPSVLWDRWFDTQPTDTITFTYTLDGASSAKVSLVPQIHVQLYRVGGLYLNTDPRLELSGSASMTDGTITEASWLLGAYADVNAGLNMVDIENDQLPAMPPFRLFTREWGDSHSVDPGPTPLTIMRQPLSQNARIGDTVVFGVEAKGSGTLRYQWYHKGVPRPGASGRELRLNRIRQGFEGDYFVRVGNANGTLDSSTATLNIVSSGSTGPGLSSMVLVQGGTLALSIGTRTVDTFYMGRYPVTWGEWKAVWIEAASRGYDIGSVGAGCADDHPVRLISWYDAIKWCNLKSELEGLTPVYTVGGEALKAGQPDHTSVSQNPSASGYRLPSEAEWEFSARGGNLTNGYTYSGSNDLNAVGWYRGNSSGAACNLVLGRGTWPVGQKAANELGLYDMSGNVWEWCWDIGSGRRSIRGGSWFIDADRCTVSYRTYISPDFQFYNFGFRLARSSGS